MLRSKICALFFLLPSARFKSYIPFVSSSLSFQLFPAVCSVLPSDLILSVSSQLFLSVRCVLSLISNLLFHLLLLFFRINSYVLFVSFFLPFQLFLSIRCRLRLSLSVVSILLFHLLLPFFRINSYVLIVQCFLPFQLFLSICCICAFVSTLLSCSFSSLFLSIPLRLRLRLSFVSILFFHLLLPFFRINSYVLIVQCFLPVSTLPFYLLPLCLRINSFVLLV